MGIYVSTNDYSVDSLDTVYSLDSFVTEKPDTYFDRDNQISQYIKFHCTTSKFRILLLLPLLSSAMILIQSGYNWAQAPMPPAPNSSILLISKNHTHTGLYALYDLQQHLILLKLLLHMVKDISKCHLLTPKDIYISKHTTIIA